MPPMRVLFLAGEASGDTHAAAVLAAARRLRPELTALAMGGERLRAAGAEIVFPLADHAVTGIVEVARGLASFRRALAEVRRLTEERAYDLLVPIDFPDFNFRAARIARAAGIPVFYYIAPQVWAWRAGRARELADLATRVGVIFPFEVEFLRRAGARVEYCGHPLLEAPPARPEGVAARAGEKILAILPGSRENERRRHLPPMREAARRLPEYRPIVSGEGEGEGKGEGLDSYAGPARDLLVVSDIALSKTGTVSLEAALLGVPTVAIYRMAPVTYWIARALVRTPYAAMPNLLLGRPLLPELIQGDATPEKIASALRDVEGRADEFRAGAVEIRRILDEGPSAPAGGRTASVRAAEILLETLDESRR